MLSHCKNQKAIVSFPLFRVCCRCILSRFHFLMHVFLKEFGVRLRAAAILAPVHDPNESLCVHAMQPTSSSTPLSDDDLLDLPELFPINQSQLLAHKSSLAASISETGKENIAATQTSELVKPLKQLRSIGEPAGIGFATLSVKLITILSHQRSQLTLVAKKKCLFLSPGACYLCDFVSIVMQISMSSSYYSM